MNTPLHIHPNIKRASTLPADFYREPQYFETSKERIFARSWLWAGDHSLLDKHTIYPLTLLENVLDEPLVFTKDKNDTIRCLSNVCTHRGKIIAETPAKGRMLTCGYHGRCFDLDGTFRRMPAFGDVENFPSAADHLHPVPFAEWLNMWFVALNPVVDFKTITAPIRERMGFLPLKKLRFDAKSSKDYTVQAHWALYCDNYLEGFHIPFVHPALNNAIAFEQYAYELFDHCSLQIGIAKEGEPAFDIPQGHPDEEKKVYAYYFFLFPNLMFNFYPWGLSLNIVRPLAPNQTQVHFRAYRFPDASSTPADNALDATELEDEAVVESVQKGMQSRFYNRGRFSPSMEKAVHHFHGLIAEYMQ